MNSRDYPTPSATTGTHEAGRKAQFLYSAEIPKPLDPTRVRQAVAFIEDYPNHDELVEKELDFIRTTMNGVYGALLSAESPYWGNQRTVLMIRQHAAYTHFVIRNGRPPKEESTERTGAITVPTVLRSPEKDTFFHLLADRTVPWEKKKELVNGKMNQIEEINKPLAWAVRKFMAHRLSWEKEIGNIGVVAVAEALRHPKEEPNLLTITTSELPAAPQGRKIALSRPFGPRR